MLRRNIIIGSDVKVIQFPDSTANQKKNSTNVFPVTVRDDR